MMRCSRGSSPWPPAYNNCNSVQSETFEVEFFHGSAFHNESFRGMLEKTFMGGCTIVKFMKAFSSESFPL